MKSLTKITGLVIIFLISVINLPAQTQADDLSILSLSQSEPDISFLTSYQVKLHTDIEGGFSVDYATSDGTATVADGDYEATTGTLTFEGYEGEVQPIYVTLLADDVVEPDETFSIELSNISNPAVNLTNSTFTATIMDSDEASLTVEDVSLPEGDGEEVVYTFTATLDKQVIGGFTATYRVYGIINANGSNLGDINELHTLEFVGTANETQSFTISTFGDTDVELDQYLRVLSTEISHDRVTNTREARGNVLADDEGLSFLGYNVSYFNESETVKKAVRSFVAVPGGFTVNYTIEPWADDINSDDLAFTSGTLTFAGVANELQYIEVPVIDDDLAELESRYRISFTEVSNPIVDISVTLDFVITDNDKARLNIEDVTHFEGNSGETIFTFVATLDKNTDPPFSINYRTMNKTASFYEGDFQETTGLLEFEGYAGEQKTFDVIVYGDTEVELDEQFQISFFPIDYHWDPVQHIIFEYPFGNIQTDDALVSFSDTSILEADAGISYASVTAMLEYDVPGGFTVDYTTLDGSATVADNDYLPVTGTLTFAGTEGEQYTITVPVVGDEKLEGREPFYVGLLNASNPNVDISATGQIDIRNDDRALLKYATDQLTVVEGDEGTSTILTIPLTLEDEIQGGVDAYVTWAYDIETRQPNSDDLSVPESSLIIHFDGYIGETYDVQIEVIGDNIVEPDEHFQMKLWRVIPVDPAVSGYDISKYVSGLITIVSDDATLSIDDVSQNEGTDGDTILTFDVNHVGVAIDGGFTVDYATVDGTASATEGDYQSTSGTLTFSGTPETQQITVVVQGDNIVEDDETIQINLSNISTTDLHVIKDTATGTITNDDFPIVTITSAEQIEGDEGSTILSIPLTLSHDVANSFSVDYTRDARYDSATLDEDFTFTSGTLVFDGYAGETHTVEVAILGDTVLEEDEFFFIHTELFGSYGMVRFTNGYAGQVTEFVILNDDVLPTITPTPTPTETATDTLTPTLTYTPSATPSPTPTETQPPTHTITPSATATLTPTLTYTPSATPSSAPTETYTPTHTITSSATETATDTLTPQPTFTTVPEPVSVLNNGGFEALSRIGKVPSNWVGKNTSLFKKDKQKCDKPEKGKYFAYSGDCAFMFKGNPTGERTRITQNIPDVNTFTDGATVAFSVYVDKRSATAGHPIGKLVIKYNNGEKDVMILRIPNAKGYQLVSNSMVIDLAGRSISKVKVQFRNRLKDGKFFIDDSQVIVIQPASLIPLPDINFRN